MNKQRKITVIAAAIGAMSLAHHAYETDFLAADVGFASLGFGASQSLVEQQPQPAATPISAAPPQSAIDRQEGDAAAAFTVTAAAAGGILAEQTVLANDQLGPPRSKSTDKTTDDKSAAIGPRAKMSGPVAALAAMGGDDDVELVVRYDQHPELFDDELVAELGGTVLRTYEILNMRAVRISVAALEELAIDENIDWLSLDDEVLSTSVSSRAAANLPATSTSNAAYGGSGVGVAILDTGVALHGDLDTNIRQYSFLNGAYPLPQINNNVITSYGDVARGDNFGHGTHVAGIVTGTGLNSQGDYKGSAGNAQVLSLQVLNGSGGGSMSDVMAALDWLLVYGSYFDIRVVNLSLGKPISESNETDPLVIAVENLWDAGIVVVVAAGNYGHYGNVTVTSPANSRKVITVGSVSDGGSGSDFSDDYVSSFSSTGPTLGDFVLKPDLIAPGNRLVAAIPASSLLAEHLSSRVRACKGPGCEDVYLEMSGTSMATPMVSAAVTLMLQKDPSLTPATIKARLMRSARKLGSNFIESGAGTLDVDAAMNDFGVMSGQALSPLVFSDPESNGIIVEDTAILWGDASWGASYLFSDGSIFTSDYAWTDANGVTSSGFAWADIGSVSASGFGWTDGGINASGFGWTDSGIQAKGFGWTDHVKPQSLLTGEGEEMVMNDDP